MDVVGKYEKAKKIMDECENSQLVLEKRKEHIKLAPKFLGNVRAGVHQQLTDKLLQRHQVLVNFRFCKRDSW
jgi:protein required for attachment to host cells